MVTLTPRQRTVGLLCAILVATGLAYARVLDGEFQFDDERAIQRSLEVKELSRFSRLDAWELPARPLTTLTLALDYAAVGLDPTGFHLVNLAIHLAAVLLAFLLARRALAAAGFPAPQGLALVVAAAFALHPIQTESVSYVIQRAESLASLFYLLALLLLLRAEEDGVRWRAALTWLAALAAAWAGLASKPVAATLPLAFLLHRAVLGRERGWPALRRGLLLAAPFLALSAFAAWQGLRVAVGAGAEDAGLAGPALPLHDALLTQPRVLFRYLGLLFLPISQSVDPDVLPSRSALEPATLVALLGLAALLIASAWAALRARPGPPSRWEPAERTAAFGALWFVLLLLPSSLVPLADPMAEHRVYLASLGIFLAVAAAIETSLAGRLAVGGRVTAAALTLGLLAFGTWERNAAWETRVALWSSAVEEAPRKARPHLNLGYGYQTAGQHDRAIVEFREALASGPSPRLEAEALRNLGASLAQLGRHDEAAAALLAAARHPDVEADARALYAMSLVQLGLLDAAYREVVRALQIDPDHGAARNTLGQVLLGRGDAAGALEQFRVAVRLNPDQPVRHLNVALALGRLGRTAEACEAWRRYFALEPDPDRAARSRPQALAQGCAAR